MKVLYVLMTLATANLLVSVHCANVTVRAVLPGGLRTRAGKRPAGAGGATPKISNFGIGGGASAIPAAVLRGGPRTRAQTRLGGKRAAGVGAGTPPKVSNIGIGGGASAVLAAVPRGGPRTRAQAGLGAGKRPAGTGGGTPPKVPNIGIGGGASAVPAAVPGGGPRTRAQARLAAAGAANVVPTTAPGGASCPSGGFGSGAGKRPNGCACNFPGACNIINDALITPINNLKTLNGIAPRGMSIFAQGSAQGTICEGDTVAVYYDCDARIPLYAAIVIEGSIAGGPFTRRTTWKTTTDPQLFKNSALLATNNDYTSSTSHIYCYKDTNGNMLEWNSTPTNKIKCINNIPAPIHRGHMIAARYGQGRAGQAGVHATFTYTNAVPQIGGFNSGPWMAAEGQVITFTKKCQAAARAKNPKIDARTYVVVGVVPSTFVGKTRFFGSPGFSESQDALPKGYRIGFPEIMWTAACCIYTDGTVADTMAFWGHNSPISNRVTHNKTPTLMFNDIQNEIAKNWPGTVFQAPTVFPSKPVAACN